MKAVCNGFLLDESRGEFKNDQGETIAYHSARIYNTDENRIMKVKIGENSNALPEPQVNCEFEFDVQVAEKFTRVIFVGYSL